MANSGTTHIEVFEQSEGLHGGPEIWVRVLSNTIVDWPSVECQLTDEQKNSLFLVNRRPLDYYPHMVTAEEKSEHGFSFEDWWTFTAPPRSAL